MKNTSHFFQKKMATDRKTIHAIIVLNLYDKCQMVSLPFEICVWSWCNCILGILIFLHSDREHFLDKHEKFSIFWLNLDFWH